MSSARARDVGGSTVVYDMVIGGGSGVGGRGGRAPSATGAAPVATGGASSTDVVWLVDRAGSGAGTLAAQAGAGVGGGCA